MAILSGANNGSPAPLIRQDSTIRTKEMNPSTKDEIKGNFHEVKGKVKETAGQVTNNADLEVEGKAEHNAGKVKKKVGRSRKCSRSKSSRLCPEHVPAFGTTDAPPFPAEYC
jgi:uncharacterized protein YjbJ (UPF0337 family)